MRPATSIYIDSQGIGHLSAIKTDEGSDWIIVENNIPENFKAFEARRRADEAARQQAQQQAQNEALRSAQNKQAIQTKVRLDLGYQSFVRSEDLVANPFVYKGTVVALQTVFVRMLSENEALFSLMRNFLTRDEVVATAVPSTMFRGNEEMILGIRVLGTRTVKTPGGEVTLPYGEYVGAYKCSQPNCGEYF